MAPYRSKPLAEGDLLAAIDLGSNSFHLIVARVEHGEVRPVHTLAERVQLGAGLKKSKLDSDAIARGLACLARFGQLLDSVEPRRIRVVGTNALRQAKNYRSFTEPAAKLLGVPVDVVYGREEARLVYLGVAHTLADDEHSRLVIDIGGGSTEFIVGQRFEPIRLQSLQLGCVSYTQRFFPKGVISKQHFKNAYDQARLEVSHIRKQFDARHWKECVGSSGTLQAIEALAKSSGLTSGGIDSAALKALRKALLGFETMADIKLEGLSEKRRDVIAAGVAITQAIFDGLDIDQMRTSSGALREGVIYDLMGRLSHEDVRERSIAAMLQRYKSDETVAELVSRRVGYLAERVQDAWKLSDANIELLRWAGRSHEIGIAIAQKHYHRHSAYLLLNSDLPGFSQNEQEIMATLVKGLQGKIRDDLLEDIPKNEREKISRMIALLRLAVVFKYVESLVTLPDFSVEVSDNTLTLTFPDGWHDLHPLTTWEIKESEAAMKKLGVKLKLA
ncbi:exopolyphosphatase [Luminiphilus syltensis NOR5-1B]|uniref:Exopolyphosphatase n=1 Tax=Luminiphilus syltensis NOR5-1B TaxID=565045 RepID=B8KSE0_9GAMM|nr:Ppx/GppA phosphatase family protein [Luminiphilus syltensis]EED34209.1 exopolyphosphatase [Luminiphilus syltensis NOR5-1B]